MEKTFTVYVLYSKQYDKIYIGVTSNLEERFKSHNELGKKGWTIKFRPWKIIHTEEYSRKTDAMQREKPLKTYRDRIWIRETIFREYAKITFPIAAQSQKSEWTSIKF